RHTSSPPWVRTRNWYSTPAVTPGTWTDQVSADPSPSRLSSAVDVQSSWDPVTETPWAFGAQTRKVAPSSCRVAPMPGCGEGALEDMAITYGQPTSGCDRARTELRCPRHG